MASLAVVAALSTGTANATQFIDTGTPTAEAGTGGDWGNLVPGAGGNRTGSESSSIVGDTYVLPSSGVEVVVADGVTVSETEDGTVEDQIIVETDGSLGAVGVLDARGTPEAVLERYVAGFGETMDEVTLVDLQTDDDVATGVYRVVTGPSELYLFISVDSESVSGHMVIQVVIAEGADVEPAIVQMRENVSVDGTPVFENVDEADVADIITNDQG